jgi:hypothetical protein
VGQQCNCLSQTLVRRELEMMCCLVCGAVYAVGVLGRGGEIEGFLSK